MTTLFKWILRILGGLLALLVAIFGVAAAMPAAADPEIDMAQHGAGASSVEPSTTGLLREFPQLNEPIDNPITAEKAELGRLLFFDPVLSENNDLACASCHQPDLGFSDGQPVATGADGQPLARNTPGLWNVGYSVNLFWDGRVGSLEDQVEIPLTHPREMGVTDVNEMRVELQSIPEYVSLFEDAFGEESITAANVANALSVFQRTLITNDSPFDRYAAGDFDALTAQQRRGLALFRSGATRCFECHSAPTFDSDTFRVIGVESDDPGRAAVAPDGRDGGFKVPTLRNVALNPPYMHNGSLETLEEVVKFYADGGGRARGVEFIDPFVNEFDLNEQELDDLVAFMHALTDESNLPEIPSRVPSGLPMVERMENPMRAVSAAYNVGSEGNALEEREPVVITVEEGESVQAAVDRAQPGDTIEISYGVYHERVVIDMSDITVRGLPNAAGNYPIFDGEGKLPEAFLSSGNNFTIGHLKVRNYTDNGVLVEGVTNVHFHDIVAEKTGAYGIYPVQSTNVLIERVEASGIDDAGVYAGQCENVVVRDSVAYNNVIGIEVENTLGAEVYNNHTYNNTTGILVVLLPQLTSKISADTKIYNNLVEDNNTENFGRAGTTVSILPPGIGILVLASDNNEVYNNTITGNKTSGVAVFSLTRSGAFDANELDVGPLPEGNWIHDNSYANNGYDPDEFVTKLGIPVGDVLWDASGGGNRFDEEGITAFPPLLPSDSWPAFVRRGYGNILNFVVGLVS